MLCRICGNQEQNSIYQAREMMFGLRDRFDYFQCAACYCLQIVEFPERMSRYYPPDYFAGPIWALTMWSIPKFLEISANLQASQSAAMTEKDLLKALAEKALIQYLPEYVAKPQTRILDVGCGTGSFLYALGELGFTNLMGVDLYIEHPIEYPNGAKVHKGTLYDLMPTWDIILLNHSFEHMPDPLETLQAIAERLSPQGVCLIRIPIASSYAWEHYRTDWVQLDAPRHFFLHSVQSLGLAAQQAGLQLYKYFCDATEFQFMMSEMYKRDIPLRSARMDFTVEELHTFTEQTVRLNLEGRGDQAAFYLVKSR